MSHHNVSSIILAILLAVSALGILLCIFVCMVRSRDRPADEEQGAIASEPIPTPQHPKSLYGLGYNETFVIEAPPCLNPISPYEYAETLSTIAEEDETSNSESDTSPSDDEDAQAWQPPLPPVERYRHGQILAAIEEEDESEFESECDPAN